MNLKDKIVVITGASSGIGRAMALAFAREGAKLVISSHNREKLDSVANQAGALSYVADVTKEEEVVSLADFAKSKFGRIDVWINNAGITMPHGSVEEADMKLAHEVFEVNFFGVVYGSRAAIRVMEGGSGTIVNVVSTSSLGGRPDYAIYSASKWAARGFTESLRLALKDKGIDVLTVHPGGTKTELWEGMKKPEKYEEYMEPEEVAEKILQNLKKDEPEKEIIVRKN